MNDIKSDLRAINVMKTINFPRLPDYNGLMDFVKGKKTMSQERALNLATIVGIPDVKDIKAVNVVMSFQSLEIREFHIDILPKRKVKRFN